MCGSSDLKKASEAGPKETSVSVLLDGAACLLDRTANAPTRPAQAKFFLKKATVRSQESFAAASL